MNITEHINENGLSRASICEKAGISRAHLSLVERNLRSIGPSKVKGLADALGVTVADLRPDLAEVFSDQPATPDAA